MTGNPWAKFFWSDWEADKELRICSLAAQGLWMRMLCICAEADPVGFLFVSGRPVSTDALASLVGKPSDQIAELVTELENNRVFSRDRHGNIYSRRMVKEEKARKTNKKNGSVGGSVSARNKKGIFAPLGDDDERVPERQTERPAERAPERPPEPHGNSQKPEARSQKPEASLEHAELLELGNAILSAFGVDPKSFMGHFGQLRDLNAQGNSPETILAVAQRLANRPGFSLRGNPIALLVKAFADELARMRTEQRQAEPIGDAEAEDEQWRHRMRRHQAGKWFDHWGPQPGEAGCRVPHHVLVEIGFAPGIGAVSNETEEADHVG